MDTNINFTEKTVVSVEEQSRDKKLETFSFIFVALTLLIAVLIFGINILITNELSKQKTREDQLIAELQSPENKKKETIYFLIKNRLQKINVIDRTRIKISSFFNNIAEINKELQVKSIKLIGASGEISVKVDDYAKFESFLSNPEKYGVVKDSIVVKQTSYDEGQYTIMFKCSFQKSS